MSVRMRLGLINTSALIGCATLTGGYCPHGENALEKVRLARLRIASQYDTAQERYSQTAQQAADHAAAAAARLEGAATALGDIYGWFDDNFPEVGGISGVLPGFTFPTTSISTPSFTPTLPDLHIPDTDALDSIASAVSGSVDNFGNQLDLSIGNANTDTSGAAANLGEWDLGGFDDYNPPTVDAWEIRDRHERESDEFEADAAVNLDALDEANRRRPNETDGGWSPIFTTNVSAAELIKQARNTNWFNYRMLEDGGFYVEWILEPIRNISSLVQVLDALYRLLKTIRILRKFWGKSGLVVSPLDVTTDAESKSRVKAAVVNPLRGTAVLLTSPGVLLSLFLTFTFLVGAVAFSIYGPIFSAYQVGCVHKDDNGASTGDGTILTTNAYSLAFNLASHDGNKRRLSGLDEYELERAETCARFGEKSANDERRVQEEMEMIVGSHVRTKPKVMLMRRCYDLPHLDAQWTAPSGSPPADAQGRAYPPISQTLADEHCDAALANTTLEDGVFDCAELPDCVIPCNDLADEDGIDNSDLRDVTRTAMCTAQWWFHSFVLRLIFSVTIWVFVNIFRAIFMMGLTRVCWNFLNTGYFTYIATCKADGTHTYEQEHLADKVHGLLGYMRLYGLALIVLSIATQVPWVAALYYFAFGLGDPSSLLSSVAARVTG
jgi:hypothetical protein